MLCKSTHVEPSTFPQSAEKICQEQSPQAPDAMPKAPPNHLLLAALRALDQGHRRAYRTNPILLPGAADGERLRKLC